MSGALEQADQTGPFEDHSAPALADKVASAVLAVPGVTSLHSGVFGEVATYLPGHRVGGIRLQGDRGEVHIAVSLQYDLLAVAEEVRSATQRLVDGPVQVVVEDVTN